MANETRLPEIKVVDNGRTILVIPNIIAYQQMCISNYNTQKHDFINTEAMEEITIEYCTRCHTVRVRLS